MDSSQLFDIAVLATLIFCAWKGATKGLVAQASWVVALVLCFKFAGELAPAVEPAIAVDQPLRKWIAMAIVYLGLCLVSFVAAGMLTTWLEKMKLKDFDRHLGALLGGLKGLIICMTVMFFGLTLSQSLRPIISNTKSAYVAAQLLHHIDPLIPLVPEGAADTVKDIVNRFNRELGNPQLPDEPRTPDAPPFGEEWSGAGETSPESSGQQSWGDVLNGITNPGNAASGGSAVSRNDPSLDQLLRELPGNLRDDLTSRTMDVLKNSTPEQKQQLLQQISNSVPQNAGNILDSFVRAFGSGQGTGTPDQAQLSRTDGLLLDQIASIYGSRDTIVAKTKEYLAGVPQIVQRRVLEDWNADVMLLQNDPDPGTNVNTPIDTRILRQLNQSGYSIDQLDRQLRTRLSQSIR
ncbi:MAG: CvpA family protein [Planctomycetaceae bacterium]|nr:CvpA family protein [Planctomycetaceae bacterium]